MTLPLICSVCLRRSSRLLVLEHRRFDCLEDVAGLVLWSPVSQIPTHGLRVLTFPTSSACNSQANARSSLTPACPVFVVCSGHETCHAIHGSDTNLLRTAGCARPSARMFLSSPLSLPSVLVSVLAG